MLQTLFVYYKLPQDDHAAWRAKVQVFADRVKSELPHATLARIAALADLYPWPSKRASEVFVELKS